MLPGHNLPFYGLHTRVAELLDHHQGRCDRIVQACRAAPKSAAELVPSVFTRRLDPHQMGFAFSEVLAHVITCCGKARSSQSQPAIASSASAPPRLANHVCRPGGGVFDNARQTS